MPEQARHLSLSDNWHTFWGRLTRWEEIPLPARPGTITYGYLRIARGIVRVGVCALILFSGTLADLLLRTIPPRPGYLLAGVSAIASLVASTYFLARMPNSADDTQDRSDLPFIVFAVAFGVCVLFVFGDVMTAFVAALVAVSTLGAIVVVRGVRHGVYSRSNTRNALLIITAFAIVGVIGLVTAVAINDVSLRR